MTAVLYCAPTPTERLTALSTIQHYRDLAAAAERDAEAATLPSVRERYQRSAAAWNAIVAQMAQVEAMTAVNLAIKNAA